MADTAKEIILKLTIDGKDAIVTLDMTEAKLKGIIPEADKLKDGYRDISAEALKYSQVSDGTIDQLTKWMAGQNLTAETIEDTIAQLQREASQLNINDSAYKNHQIAIDNLRGAYGRIVTAHRDVGNSARNTVPGLGHMQQAMGQLGWAFGDADMFMVDFRMGMRSIANNIPMVAQSFIYAAQSIKGTEMSMKSLVTNAIKGGGGLMLGINGLMLLMNVLPGLFDDTTASMKKLNEESAQTEIKMRAEQLQFEELGKRLSDVNLKTTDRKSLIEDMQKIQPEFLKGVDAERLTYAELIVELSKANTELERNIRLKVVQKKIEENYEKQASLELTLKSSEEPGFWDTLLDPFTMQATKAKLTTSGLKEQLTDTRKEADELWKQLDEVKKKFALQEDNEIKTIGDKKERLKKDIQYLEIQKDNLSATASKAELDKYDKLIEAKQKELDSLSGKKDKGFGNNTFEKQLKEEFDNNQKALTLTYEHEIKKAELNNEGELYILAIKRAQYEAQLQLTRDYLLKVEALYSRSKDKGLIGNIEAIKNSIFELSNAIAETEIQFNVTYKTAIPQIPVENPEDISLGDFALADLDRLRAENIQNEFDRQRALADFEFAMMQEKYEGYANYNEIKLELEKQHTDQLESIERSRKLAQLELAKQTLNSLAGMFNENTAAFKAIAIAQAIINTYEGATKALAQGGIFGPVLAATVIAAGMVQVANIASTDTPKMKGYKEGGAIVGENGIEIIAPAQDFASGMAELVNRSVGKVEDYLMGKAVVVDRAATEIRALVYGGSSNNDLLNEIKLMREQFKRFTDKPLEAVAYLDHSEARRIYREGKRAEGRERF